jgi:hypothetical protein
MTRVDLYTCANPHIGVRNEFVERGKSGRKFFATVTRKGKGVIVRVTSETTWDGEAWVSSQVKPADLKRRSYEFGAPVPDADVRAGYVMLDSIGSGLESEKAKVYAAERRLLDEFKESTSPLTAAMFGADAESSGTESSDDEPIGQPPREKKRPREEFENDTTGSSGTDSEDYSTTESSGTESSDNEPIGQSPRKKMRQAVVSSDDESGGSSGSEDDSKKAETGSSGSGDDSGDSETGSPAECGEAAPTRDEVTAMMAAMAEAMHPAMVQLARDQIRAAERAEAARVAREQAIKRDYDLKMAALTEEHAAAVKALDERLAAEQAKATAKRDRDMAAVAGANAQAAKRDRDMAAAAGANAQAAKRARSE